MARSILITVLSFFLLTCACKKDPAAPKVNFPEGKGILKPGESGVFSTPGGERIEIKLVKLNDSRCPEGLSCLWEGQVTVDVLINKSENFQISSGNQPPGPLFYKGYKISIGTVTPYPKENIRINYHEYQVEFIVSK